MSKTSLLRIGFVSIVQDITLFKNFDLIERIYWTNKGSFGEFKPATMTRDGIKKYKRMVKLKRKNDNCVILLRYEQDKPHLGQMAVHMQQTKHVNYNILCDKIERIN